MSQPTRSWKDVLADEPVNEKRAEIYEQLMEAQEQIAQLKQAVFEYRAGCTLKT